MNSNVRFEAEADAEYRAAGRWYEERRIGSASNSSTPSTPRSHRLSGCRKLERRPNNSPQTCPSVGRLSSGFPTTSSTLS